MGSPSHTLAKSADTRVLLSGQPGCFHVGCPSKLGWGHVGSRSRPMRSLLALHIPSTPLSSWLLDRHGGYSQEWSLKSSLTV